MAPCVRTRAGEELVSLCTRPMLVAMIELVFKSFQSPKPASQPLWCTCVFTRRGRAIEYITRPGTNYTFEEASLGIRRLLANLESFPKHFPPLHEKERPMLCFSIVGIAERGGSPTKRGDVL